DVFLAAQFTEMQFIAQWRVDGDSACHWCSRPVGAPSRSFDTERSWKNEPLYGNSNFCQKIGLPKGKLPLLPLGSGLGKA
ncbi:hypothetical protein, partial [Delftia tsuruhatensis]|uniref:hypothetical protein n=1 Tax=Delftia tsuruhatensis TaxID=180282 RepID=UPI0028AB4232